LPRAGIQGDNDCHIDTSRDTGAGEGVDTRWHSLHG